MAEQRDISFETLLRNTLKAEAASLPLAIGPGDVLRRREVRRRQHGSRRLRLLLIAALIALALGALAVGALRPDPSAQGYSAVLVGGLGDPTVHVLLANDGSAERVLDMPVSRLGPVQIERPLEASSSGWITLMAGDEAGNEYVVMLDVRSPDETPIVREGTYHGAFTPAGLYWSATNTAYELIDLASGSVISLPRSVAEDLDWWYGGVDSRMRVAADGSGLLLGDPRNTAPHFMEPAIPDQIAEALREVIQRWRASTPAGRTF
jgi:hypothetical protein